MPVAPEQELTTVTQPDNLCAPVRAVIPFVTKASTQKPHHQLPPMSWRGLIKKALPLLPHYLNLRASKIFLSALLIWLLLFQFCRIKFWRDPHSAFFQEPHVYELGYSLHREREARHFISRHNSDLEPPPYVKSDLTPQVCVSFVTVRRDLDDYFEPSGSSLEGLDEQERSKLYLSLLFANTEPRLHPSWGQRWLERLADSATTYNVSVKQLEHLQELEKQRNFYEKGVL